MGHPSPGLMIRVFIKPGRWSMGIRRVFLNSLKKKTNIVLIPGQMRNIIGRFLGKIPGDR